MHRSAPIAVFAYDRPAHLEIALSALARCPGFDPDRLHVFCDAAAREEDVPGCAAAREVARRWVGRRGGRLVERPRNYRFRNLTEAIGELCADRGRVVVVEDDVVVSPDFLAYVDAALDRYAEDPRVFMVGGYMYAAEHPPEPALFFAPIALAWGWATWKRAWDLYEYHPRDWRAVLAEAKARRRFDAGGSFAYAETLERTMDGGFDSWDTQWYFTLFRHGGLGLYPARSLVWNSGLGGGFHHPDDPQALDRRDAVIHGAATRQDFAAPRLPPGWAWPQRVAADAEAFARIGRALARYARGGQLGVRDPGNGGQAG